MPPPPFVLLDDARTPGARARLYTAPIEIVTTRRPGEVAAALAALRTATRGGLHAAGYLTYDAGAAIVGRPPSSADGDAPLLWFGLFRGFDTVDAAALLPDLEAGWLGRAVPTIGREAYVDQLARIQALIAAGDIYQANLTFEATVATAGHPLALYAGLRARAAAGYGAVVATGAHWLLSLSPELFFTLDGDHLVTRPMKGTAPPDSDPGALASDPKQRAENLMIVDLLRNDLSQVAVPGSVAVPELFAIEHYPTVLQMTSTVTATLGPARDAIDVLSALFPCGSITGAPKLRAMEVIGDVENRPRGAYTGAIGRIDANGDAAFNVAIRTLTLDEGTSDARLGLGSGVVADSRADAEWNECLAKGAFVPSPRRFDLIETMRFEPAGGVMRLDRHLARMSESAAAFGFSFDAHALRNELQAATFRLRAPARIRLLLAPSGAVSIEVGPLPTDPACADVVVRLLPVACEDFRLRYKTTDRAFYDDSRAGAFECIFLSADGRVTEGSFTNVFVHAGATLATPPLEHGLLGGVLRSELIETGAAIERPLTLADLADGFLIGNALRGLLPARLVEL